MRAEGNKTADIWAKAVAENDADASGRAEGYFKEASLSHLTNGGQARRGQRRAVQQSCQPVRGYLPVRTTWEGSHSAPASVAGAPAIGMLFSEESKARREGQSEYPFSGFHSVVSFVFPLVRLFSLLYFLWRAPGAGDWEASTMTAAGTRMLRRSAGPCGNLIYP